MAFLMVQFAPHKTIVQEVALLEDTPETRKGDCKPDILIGRDLIKALGLTLDFAADPRGKMPWYPSYLEAIGVKND
jgi:hypothetical protein